MNGSVTGLPLPDGEVDIITGAAAVRHGLHLGEAVSGAVRTVRGITVE